MIRSFRSKTTEKLYRELKPAPEFSNIAKQALRRLQQLDAATNLGDLTLPGNKLEKLRGDRRGQYSIRINNQWRVCFRWDARDAWDVEIVDYH